VTPGDQLVFELKMVSKKTKICQMDGKAFVNGALVAEAEMMASIIDRTAVRPQPNGGDGTPSAPVSRSHPTMN
jgi:hypothetical protein